MKLLIASHKPCWALDGGGAATDGGFPRQVEALSTLFDETAVMATLARRPPPGGLSPLRGERLRLCLLDEPRGKGIVRKLLLAWWWLRHAPEILREIRRCDVVHALVPGDVGLLLLATALALHKRVFVRHCGTWGNRRTIADRVLAWLLPRIARRGAVVLATGGGPEPPEPGRREIEWIFSTTLREDELQGIPRARAWAPGSPLRLVSVGRLTGAKNTRACVEALAVLRPELGDVSLDIVGDGPDRDQLVRLAGRLGVADRVSLHGNVGHDRVLEVMANAHVFLIPTRTAEGFPKAVLEAMACGLPVLAAPVSVLPALMAEGAGRVLAGTSGEDVAEAVRELGRDPDALAGLGDRGRELARSYTLEAWAARIRERLERAWGEPLRGADAGPVA